jgi:N-acetylneuraminate synthase
MQMKMQINGRKIGPGHKPYFIAELSGNHNGDINRAFRLIEKAKECGAEAVKLQTYTADTITIDHDGPGFVQEGGLWAGRSLYDLYQEASTPWEWHKPLFQKANEVGIDIFSSPFDESAIELLENLNTPAYKIASFEIVDHNLIAAAASTKKPLIISTGLATVDEIGEAIEVARDAGATEICVLHCTSGYPTPLSESHLNTIPDLISRFDTLVGLSDHTPGIAAPVAAMVLGASIFEKHFTLDRDDGGIDSSFSINPDELKSVCRTLSEAHEALGTANYELKPSEQNTRDSRRSLYVVQYMKKGQKITRENVRSIRPGFGLPPKHLNKILGCTVNVDLKRGEPLKIDYVD